MKQILVYGDSLSWGIVPGTRQRLAFSQRWPGVVEAELKAQGHDVRIIDDPFKPGRNGLIGLAQRIEVNSPLDLVVVMLGTNDFQSMHEHNAWHSAQGMATIVSTMRHAPIEPGMVVPPILIVAPPPIKAPKGAIAPKFLGADIRCDGLAAAYRRICVELQCSFFDAADVIAVSPVDGVHIDADAHARLGQALASVIAAAAGCKRQPSE